MEEILKKCPRCLVTKSHEDFHRDRSASDGLYGYCKVCAIAKTRAHYEVNKDTINAARAATHFPGKQRGMQLWRKYKITTAEWDQMLAAQGGGCKICGTAYKQIPHPTNGMRSNMAVDHDHETGLVRGLLCQSCNRAIGLLKDDSKLLRLAAEYLEQF